MDKFDNDFYKYCNKIYLNKKLPKNSSTKNNFSDVNNRCIKKIIKIANNTNNFSINNNNYIYIFHLLYNKYIQHYTNTNNHIDDFNYFNKYFNIIYDNNISLEEKIHFLNINGVSCFIDINVMTNPCMDDTNAYVISISSSNLTFHKNYYMSDKYKNEMDKYKDFLINFTDYISNNYKHLNIDNELFLNFEYDIAKYIFTIEEQNNFKERINSYNFSIISKYLNSINLLKIFNIYEFTNKNIDINNYNVIFDTNINNKNSNLNNNYWKFINKIFNDYNNNINRNKIDNYMMFKVLFKYINVFDLNLEKISFDFFGKIINGQHKMKSLEHRAINFCIKYIPELVGLIYCKKYFNKKKKNNINFFIDYIGSSFVDYLNNSFISIDQNSLDHSLLKLKTVLSNRKIGYPNKKSFHSNYIKLSNLINDITTINNNNNHNINFCQIVSILNSWNYVIDNDNLKLTSKNILKWNMSAIETNAYYSPLLNTIVFPAGILQPPFFIYVGTNHNDFIDLSNNNLHKLLEDRIRLSNEFPHLKYITNATNFGSICSVIGHEISHAFDKNGSQFDYNGILRKWWDDKVLFEYDKFIVHFIDKFNKVGVNGSLTIGENMADFIGLSVCINAYKKYYNDGVNKGLNMIITIEQGIFELLVAYSMLWRCIYNEKSLKYKLTNDVHSPAMYRVNLVVDNFL